MRGIDYTALRTAPKPGDVAAWRESVRRADDAAGLHGPASDPPDVRLPGWFGKATLIALFFIALSVPVAVWQFVREGETAGLAVTLVLGIVVTAVLIAVYRRRMERLAEGWDEPFRLAQFARDNNLLAAPVADPADLPGKIFGRGLPGNRVRHDVVTWRQQGRAVEVATESWNSGKPPGGGEPEDAGSCRYLAVELGAASAIPPMALRVWEDQFSAVRGMPHVQFQVPTGGEELAKAIFNDEVLRWLTAPEQPREAEVIEGWFLAYDLTPADPLDVAAWERTFALVNALPIDLPAIHDS